jgi:quinol monooxygenase YgiN
MHITRRDFIAVIGTSAVVAAGPGYCVSLKGTTGMYGLIGKMKALPGERDALIAILVEGVGSMPGCLSYIIAQDPTDADGIWVTEAWDSRDSHQASLSLPSVRQAIARGKPLIAGFGERFETVPVGGHGLGARGQAT